MPIAAVRYLTLALKHPLARQSGILRGGFGIESRAESYSEMWQPHLDRSKRFVLRTLGPASGSDSLLILGAGRLYDVPIEQLAELYKKIYLVDADPSCLRFHQFNSARCEITSTILDITGALSRFMEVLRFVKFQSWDDALKFPESASLDPEQLNLPLGCDIISINVLSQLSLPFRDLFESRLKKQFGRATVDREDTNWLTAFQAFGSRIVRGHLELINSLSPNQIVLITDTENAYYKSAHRYQQPPITPQAGPFAWKAINKSVEPLEVSSALSDVDIGTELETSFPEHRRTASELWAWHLNPSSGQNSSRQNANRQNPNRQNLGQVNRVEGFLLRK